MNEPSGTYSNNSLEFLRYSPSFVKRILLIGWDETLALALARRSKGTVVCVLEEEPNRVEAAKTLPPGIQFITQLGSPLPFPGQCADQIIIPLANADDMSRLLPAMRQCLDENGSILAIIPNTKSLNQNDAEAELRGIAAQTGFALFNFLCDPASATEAPPEFLAVLVRSDYDLLAHARGFFNANNLLAAYDLLAETPEKYRDEHNLKIPMSAELQLCLLAWMKSAPDDAVMQKLFYNIRALFHLVISEQPDSVQAFRCQAQAWKDAGNEDMAARILRSFLRFYPNENASQQLRPYHPARTVQPPEYETTPEWIDPGRAQRILFITHMRPHYGLDVLYEGLCDLFGDEQIVEYPWKPTLHGQIPEKFAHYPCNCNRKGGPLELEAILLQLANGEFDLVLFGDIEQKIDQDEARRISEAAGNTPFFVLDQQDDPLDNYARTLEYLGRPGANGYFKREMLACWNYHENTVPLPFGYSGRRISTDISTARTQPVFWAGHRQFGLRKLYLDRVEGLFSLQLNRAYSQEEYAKALASSHIGLNFFGFGFDTVRYWEIPANGTMLLSDKLPIRVPYNFRDGESAVFFTDLKELELKLEYYMNHPDEARGIAHSGYEHLKRRHTAVERAKQMMAWTRQLSLK